MSSFASGVPCSWGQHMAAEQATGVGQAQQQCFRSAKWRQTRGRKCRSPKRIHFFEQLAFSWHHLVWAQDAEGTQVGMVPALWNCDGPRLPASVSKLTLMRGLAPTPEAPPWSSVLKEVVQGLCLPC